MSAPVFLIAPEALDGDEACLGPAESHHARVRRLGIGAAVVLVDGAGRQREGVIVARARGTVRVRFTTAVRRGVESPLHLTLAQAALQGNRLDLVVEKATELGVTAIVLFTCTRALGTATPYRLARCARVARSAAAQSGRASVPAIRGPLAWPAVLAEGAPAARRLLLVEPQARAGGRPLLDLRAAPPCGRVVLIAGPEGGFTAAEVDDALRSGCEPVALGGRVLRAETAAVAAVTLCQFLWGDLAVP